MLFYTLELKTPPLILFAVDAVVKNYRNQFHQRKNYLEICIVKEGVVIAKKSDGIEFRQTPKSVSCITQDADIDCRAEKNALQRHLTVAIRAEYESELFDTETDACEYQRFREKVKRGCFLIPYSTSLDNYYEHAVNALEKIVRYFHSDSPVKNGVEAIEKWYSLVGLLTQYVLQDLTRSYKQPTQQKYVEQTVAYIRENVSSSLCLKEIAYYLGVSVGYLCNLFKKEMGTTIVQYINEYRIRLIKQDVLLGQTNLSSLAKKVGLNDPLYASRLFKKVTGFSFREYLTNLLSDDGNQFLDNSKS